ncbi:MAG: hypothetical protein M3552_03995 [Planctomycetota bacterium]|nr:hypothetical protein [Planctomycetaceae bacterium]MDQ3329803.1 hypothetical protein [Planctomycetota bacterium]
MRRVAAGVLFVAGAGVAAIGLFGLFAAGFVVVAMLVWEHFGADVAFHDSYFEIDGEPVSDATCYMLLFGTPVALIGVGSGFVMLGGSCWKIRDDQQKVTARPS